MIFYLLVWTLSWEAVGNEDINHNACDESGIETEGGYNVGNLENMS